MSSPVVRQFLKFAVIGALGFVVDSGVLWLMLNFAHTGLYASRVVSFLCAASFTWLANRLFTFTQGRKQNPGAQWLRFVVANGVGGLVNFGVYAGLVSHWSTAHESPIIGVAAGSIAGLGFNFVLSRLFVFRP